MTLALALGLTPQIWQHVKRNDPLCRELADQHYSRQTPGARDFMSSGKTFVLRADFAPYFHPPLHERFVDSHAVWGAIENWDGGHVRHFRCSIFRNHTAWISSWLIREATRITQERWSRAFHWTGTPPLRTEVDPAKVRHKRDPGRCFLKAGWTMTDIVTTRGLIVLEAPLYNPESP